jgi:hypothetical protein
MAKAKSKEAEKPEDTAQVTEESLSADLLDIGVSSKSMDDMIKESPITAGDASKSAETEADEAKAIPKGEVPADKELPPKPEEPAEEKEVETKPDDSPKEEVKAEEKETAPPELTEEQKAWKHAYDSREKWETTLKQKSQAFSWWEKLTDEQKELVQPKLMNLVYGKEKIPDTPAEVVSETVDRVKALIPEKISYTDSEGYENIIPRDKVVESIGLNKIIGEAVKQVVPDVGTLRGEHQALVENHKKLEAERDDLKVSFILMRLQALTAKHPEIEITPIKENEPIIERIQRVQEAGTTHPEYAILARIQAVSDATLKYNVDEEAAWNILYGHTDLKEKKKKEAEEAVKAEQEKIQPEKPGKTVQPSPKEKFFKETGLAQPAADKVAEMFE